MGSQPRATGLRDALASVKRHQDTKVQDLSAQMKTKKEVLKVIFRAKSAFIFEITRSV